MTAEQRNMLAIAIKLLIQHNFSFGIYDDDTYLVATNSTYAKYGVRAESIETYSKNENEMIFPIITPKNKYVGCICVDFTTHTCADSNYIQAIADMLSEC